MPNQAIAPVQYGRRAINLLACANLGAGGANTSLAARVRRDACEQVGRERGLVAPTRRLLDAGHTFQLPGALVGLPAQRAARGVNGLGFLHGEAPVLGLGTSTNAQVYSLASSISTL